MSRFFKKFLKTSGTRNPQSAVESGPHKKEHGTSFAICRKCHDVYYKKSWHHETNFLSEGEIDELETQFVLCPADTMIEKGQYEGMVTIKNIPTKISAELLNFIKGYGRRARLRDSQVRIIEIDRDGDAVVVTTTENQLASKLAKKIHDTFKHSEVKIAHSQEPYQVTRAEVSFS